MKSWQYDSPEDGGNALKGLVEQIINQGADQSATRDELEAQIIDKMRTQNEWDQSVERFRSEFKDLNEDPMLRQLTTNIADAYWGHAVEQANKNGGGRPGYWQIWEAAGRTTREWLTSKGVENGSNEDSKASSDPTPSVAIDPDRANRKRVAAQTPEPRQPQRRSEPDAPAVNSEASLLTIRRDAISDMQKARGQAQ
jgi:hypothetical protein